MPLQQAEVVVGRQPVRDARPIAVVVRWITLVGAATGIGATLAFGVSSLIPREYKATAQLYVAAANNPASVVQEDVVSGGRVANTYAQLATADVVLRPAMQNIGATDLEAFRNRLQVSQLRDTSIINVSFIDHEPARAASASNAVAQSFITQNQALQTSVQSSAISRLEGQIRSVQAELRTLEGQIASLRAVSPPTSDLQSQLQALESQRLLKQQTLAQVQKTSDDVQLASARAANTVTLWQPASAPSQPDSPRVMQNVILGALAGGLLALMAVAISRVA